MCEVYRILTCMLTRRTIRSVASTGLPYGSGARRQRESAGFVTMTTAAIHTYAGTEVHQGEVMTYRTGIAALLLGMVGWMSSAQAAPGPSGAGGFSEPVLLGSSPSHNDRLFVAIFDCSWKHAVKGPSEPTTAEWIDRQLTRTDAQEKNRVVSGYIQTDCATHNWLTEPGHGEAFNGTRLAQMYKLLAKQSARWLNDDPKTRINLLIVGGSWGALQAAEFSMTVAELGLRSPDGHRLVAPRQTAQAMVLIAPTGVMPDGLRLPSSLLSAVQLTPTDEHRPDFQTLPVLPAGITPDGRFANLSVPGSLSDVCGGYRLNGLSNRAGNLVVDYVNGLSQQPLLPKLAEPDDPRFNVVHRSEAEGR